MTTETKDNPAVWASSSAYSPMTLDLMSEEDLAATFRIEVNTLRVWRREEKGPPYVKIGRTTFYRGEDVSAWLSLSVRVPIETKMPHPYQPRPYFSSSNAIATGSGVVTGPVSNLPFTGDNTGVKL